MLSGLKGGTAVLRKSFGVRRIAALALAAALIAGISPGARAQSTTQPAASKVQVAIKAYENNLTPFTLTLLGLPVSNDLTHLVYDALFWSQVKEDPEPWLAERADPSPDRKVWTVKLRAGVTWHDGQPLTAEDVAFTFQYMKGVPGGRYSHHVWEYPVFETAEVLDPLTVRLTFKDAAPTFKILPGADLPIVPKHIWEGIADPTRATDILPIGSGPYKMVQIIPNQLYRLEANPTYFKGKPKVAQLEFPIVPDPSAAFAALQTGQVDSVDRSVPPELVDQMKNQPGINIVKGTRMESVHLHFNNTKAPLSDARLRKGITEALDLEALVKTVLLGYGRPGRDGWVHPDSPWADPQGKHDYDLAKSNKTLDDAGYKRSPNGLRTTPDGKPLEFTISVAANEPQHQRAAQVVAQQAEAIGVKFNLESLDPATLRARRNAGNYDSFITNLESHAHADPDALYFFFHSPSPGTGGPLFGGYSNPKFDALVEQARSQIDVNEAQRVFAQDAPVQVLYYPDGIYAYRPAAYNGWISDPGHGILTKRSFIPGYENASTAAASGSGGTNGPPWAAIIVVLVVGAVIGGVLTARSRRRGELEPEEA
jgi:peptide/nickel transport system substrate-binding protein